MKMSGTTIAMSLVFAVFLWGGSNSASKFLARDWPPLWAGSTRFLAAGVIMLGLMKCTSWLGKPRSLSRQQSRDLWLKGGLTLAAYLVLFYWAIKLTAVSHVALYLGASPVWALVMEGKPEKSWKSVQCYGAALLALAGVIVLFLPTLLEDPSQWLGEVLGLGCSVLWALYGRQCRALSRNLSGVEVSTHTMWRAGTLLIPFVILELISRPVVITLPHLGAQFFCILGGSVLAFGIWNNALQHWPTSKVYLFNNLIPLSTMVWAHLVLDEPISPTFWLAMLMIVTAVLIGQADWKKIWSTMKGNSRR